MTLSIGWLAAREERKHRCFAADRRKPLLFENASHYACPGQDG
jgi:hypothetical protein